MSDERISVDEMLLIVADTFGLRSTCSRAQIGAVLAKDGRVLSSGYNGAPSHMPHCTDIDHPPITETCTKSVHAEANAIAFAARIGISTDGATLYCTQTPCLKCAQLLINSGIVRVVAAFPYRDSAGVQLLHDAGIETTIMMEKVPD